jgi:hypothetical protein
VRESVKAVGEKSAKAFLKQKYVLYLFPSSELNPAAGGFGDGRMARGNALERLRPTTRNASWGGKGFFYLDSL